MVFSRSKEPLAAKRHQYVLFRTTPPNKKAHQRFGVDGLKKCVCGTSISVLGKELV